MRLALVSIMLDEEAIVPRWASMAKRIEGAFDECVVIDGESTDRTVAVLEEHGICAVVRPFQGDYADQRNFALSLVLADWVLELDADETVSTPLLCGLRAIIDQAEAAGVDCVGIARLNFIDGVHVEGPGHRGLDWQYRLHRRECRWRGAVHEELANGRARIELALHDGHFLIHEKSSARHEARNAFYRSLRP